MTNSKLYIAKLPMKCMKKRSKLSGIVRAAMVATSIHLAIACYLTNEYLNYKQGSSQSLPEQNFTQEYKETIRTYETKIKLKGIDGAIQRMQGDSRYEKTIEYLKKRKEVKRLEEEKYEKKRSIKPDNNPMLLKGSRPTYS